MQRHTHQGLDLDSEICLVSCVGLMGAGLLSASLGELSFAAVFVACGIGVGMTTTAARGLVKRATRNKH